MNVNEAELYLKAINMANLRCPRCPHLESQQREEPELDEKGCLSIWKHEVFRCKLDDKKHVPKQWAMYVCTTKEYKGCYDYTDFRKHRRAQIRVFKRFFK